MNKIDYLLGYIGMTSIYSLGRSYKYLNNTCDSTYVGHGENIRHPTTLSRKVLYTSSHLAMGPLLFPFSVYNDLEIYFKGRDISPPFPFTTLYWKDEKKE